MLLIDGNARAMTDAELVSFIKREKMGLVGIGAMTRMIAKAYRVADAIRGAGVPVVMGGPHVTECPTRPWVAMVARDMLSRSVRQTKHGHCSCTMPPTVN